MAVMKCGVLLGLILSGSFTNGEPVCSKFHYEEQLLEKMVRVEWKMEQMQDNIKKLENDMDSKIAAFGNRIDSMMQNFNDIVANITGIAEDLEHTKTATKESAETYAKGSSTDQVVAFSAHQLKDVSVSAGQRMVFVHTDFNEGVDYDVSTGIFTAPVGGVYLFSAHLCNYVGKEAAYAIVNDGTATKMNSIQSDNDFYSCNSLNVVMKVEAGGKVWIECTYGSGTAHFYQNSYRRLMFVGVLLREM